MILLKKTIIVIITLLFILWGQLAAIQNDCNCSFHNQYQNESTHSCCPDQQEMTSCRVSASKEAIQKSGDDLESGSRSAQLNRSHELCQSECEIQAFDDRYFSSITNSFDTNLLLNSTLSALLPVEVGYPCLRDKHIFQYTSIPIFLLNVSFLN